PGRHPEAFTYGVRPSEQLRGLQAAAAERLLQAYQDLAIDAAPVLGRPPLQQAVQLSGNPFDRERWHGMEPKWNRNGTAGRNVPALVGDVKLRSPTADPGAMPRAYTY